jgi:predicted transcriptional regulator
MTRAHHVTHSYTAARIERLRLLITALQAKPLTRDEIGAVLGVGPSGVRKYLVDLRGKCAVAISAGEEVIRLAVDDAEIASVLGELSAAALARSAAKVPAAPVVDPSRRIHIMLDDGPFKVRQLRGMPAHEPMMAHFYGMVRAEARV